ncbi:MAG: energy-coupling factor transporter transmembrane protein EcfT [Chloroflexi bacterium]|jgi:energy-coupling factor transporter transmembrane protein EcfT|nr:energy-coupling factor transporter transmembrane protein EcfT [Chloroflexota bacterium]
MISARDLHLTRAHIKTVSGLGTGGYLALLFWSLAVVIFASPQNIFLGAGLCLLVTLVCYPRSLRRLLMLRCVVPLTLLVVMNALLFGEADQTIAGIPFSLQGLHSGLVMVVRAAVILVAVDGFSSKVDVVEVAGLFERIGLPGLGFAIGTAVNLLPGLRSSAAATWRSLQMRGGLRSQRRRGLQLFMLTVLTNALRRGEEIALAAEARAYNPEHSRRLPLRSGRWDVWLALAAVISLIPFMIFR